MVLAGWQELPEIQLYQAIPNVSFRVRPDLFKKGFSSFLCFFSLVLGLFFIVCLFVCLGALLLFFLCLSVKHYDEG